MNNDYILARVRDGYVDTAVGVGGIAPMRMR